MARSIETIYAEIITAKETKPELEVLDSTSVTAVWRLLAYVVASVIFTVETMWDLFKAEVEGILASQRPGTLLWYRSVCLGFKYGVGLIVDNGRIGYPLGDTTPPLLAQWSPREAADGLVIKIAKEANGELEPLSEGESNSFNAFISAIKYAGTPIRVINSPANLLKTNITVFYDPLIFKPNGELILDSTRPVDIAIQSFLRNLPFDGRLKRTTLGEKILKVPGVSDIKINSLQHKYENYPYAEIDISHVPESGYFKIDPNFTLESTIIYLPYV